MSRTTHRALRLALASLIATALVAQLVIGLSRSDLTIARFLSFFTVLSSSAAVVMLALLAGRPRRDGSAGFATFRGAVTLYMGVAGLVYALLHAPGSADVGITEPWVDWTLHVVGPVALTLDWAFSPPPVRLRAATVVAWLMFPAAYLGYTLIRGPIVDWYPYSTLDPNDSDGYAEVALWCAAALGGIVVLGALYWWWANRQAPEGKPA